MDLQVNNLKLKDLLSQRDKLLAKNDYSEAAVLCNRIGNLYSERGQLENALQAHEQELKLSQRLKDKLSQAIAYRRIADCLKLLGKFENAVENCLEFKRLAEVVGDLKEVQRAEATMGSILLDKLAVQGEELSPMERTDVVRRALESLSRSLEAVDRLTDRRHDKALQEETFEMRMAAFKNLSLIYEMNKDEDAAIDYLTRYKEAAEEHQKMAHQIDADLLLSQSLLKWKKPARALVNAKRCVNLAFSEKAKANREKKEECLRTKGRCLVQLRRFQEAVKCFKSCYNMVKKHDLDEARCDETTIKTLICVVAAELSLTTCLTVDEKGRILERLGDLCASPHVDHLEAALDFYRKQEEAFRESGKSLVELQPVYNSVAVTARDLNLHALALEYFQKELEACRYASGDGNLKEIADSLLNVAQARVKCDDSPEEINDAFRFAAQKARLVQDVPRLREVLESWSHFVKSKLEGSEEGYDGEMMTDIREEIDAELSRLEESALLEEEEEEESSSRVPETMPDIVEAVNLDDALSDYSEDSDVDAHAVMKLKGAKQRGGGRRAAKEDDKNKTNRFGETPLHEAAKSGDARRLKKLMEMKWRVNTHDFTGIAPLHDAALGGYYDVVQLLLKGGADVDDPGNNWKEAKTPFLCAAANGNVDIMKLLLTYGAKSNAKDFAGRDVFDYLNTFRGSDIVEEFIVQLREHSSTTNIITTTRSKKKSDDPSESDLEQRYLNVLSTSTSDYSGLENREKRKDPTYEPLASSQMSSTELETHEETVTNDDDSSDFGLESMGKKSARFTAIADTENEDDMLQHEIDRLRSSAYSRSGQSSGYASAPRGIDDDYVNDDIGENFSRRDDRMNERDKEDTDEDDAYEEADWIDDDMGLCKNPSKPRKRSSAEAVCETTSGGGVGAGGGGGRGAGTGRRGTGDASEEYTDEDNAYEEADWIDDDMGLCKNLSKPRKRSLAEAFCETTSGGGGGGGGGRGTGTGRRSMGDASKKKLKLCGKTQTKLTQVCRRSQPIARRTSESDERNGGGNDDSNVLKSSSGRFGRKNSFRKSTQPKLSAFGVGETVGPSSSSTVKIPTFLPERLVNVTNDESSDSAASSSTKIITVRIDGHAFLVPFPATINGLTISWLCNEASNRYSRKFGPRPVLTCFCAGAMVEKDDPLSVVDRLAEVECKIDSWYCVAAADRYADCCASESVTPIDAVSALFRASEIGTLNLSDVAFETPAALVASLKALNGHEKLHALNLTGINLTEMNLNVNEWTFFANAIVSLKHLKELDISACCLSGRHLQKIVKSASNSCDTDPSFQTSMRKLNVSYNSLNDDGAVHVASLINKLPNLHHLNLEGVGLVDPPSQLATALSGSCIRELNISHNYLTASAFNSVLPAMHSCVTVNVSSVLDRVENGFCEGLMKLTTNSETRLQILDISNNAVPSHAAFDLCAALCEAKKLNSLNVTSSVCINDDVLAYLLRKKSRTLKKIELDDVGIHRPMKMELVDALVDCFAEMNFVSLSRLHVDDFATLTDRWRDIKGADAIVAGPTGRHRTCKFFLSRE